MIGKINIRIIYFFLLLAACRNPIHEPVVNMQLNTGWEFRQFGESEWKQAVIPGDIVVNLLLNNLLTDSQIIINPQSIKWIEKEEWEYRTTFNISHELFNQENITLIFKGLDTYADVYLNDNLLLKTDNMFRKWEISCKHLLKPDNNKLKIRFHSVYNKSQITATLDLKTNQDKRNFNENYSQDFIRKASYHFGKDWSPPILSCGINEPVIIQGWSKVKIEDIYFYLLSLSDKEAQYNAEISVLTSKELILNLEILVDNKYVIKLYELYLKQGLNKQIVSFNIRNPKLWWINGLGRPHLYNVSVRLKLSDQIVDEKNTKLGVRKFELTGAKGSDSLYFKLNDIPVYLKGAFFMPPDMFLSRVDSSHITKLLKSAKDANINFLRVWGEGYYPDDLFYNLCDEYGILVWQDFIFSNILTMDSLKTNGLLQEYLYYFKRLRNHPSLSVWYGNNIIPKNTGLPLDTIEAINYRINQWFKNSLDKENGYKPNYFLFPINKNLKNEIKFNPFKRINYNYTIKSSPDFKTLEEYKLLNIFKIDNTIFSVQKPNNINDQIYLSQIQQANNVKQCIENDRIQKPRIMGSVIWHYNDCWPIISSSVIDFQNRFKPAYYVLNKAFAGVIVVPLLKDGYIKIIGINDEQKDLDAILLCKLIDFYGQDFYVKQIPVKINANSSEVLLSLKESEVLAVRNKQNTCFLVELNQPGQKIAQNILYFVNYDKLKLPEPQISIDVNQSPKGFNIIAKSDVLIRNFVMHTHNKESLFSENNIDLLPGKRYKILVQYPGTKDELKMDLELVSLNNFFTQNN